MQPGFTTLPPFNSMPDLYPRRPSTYQADNECNQEKDDKEEEKNLRNAGSASSDATKAKQCGYNGNNKEGQC